MWKTPAVSLSQPTLNRWNSLGYFSEIQLTGLEYRFTQGYLGVEGVNRHYDIIKVILNKNQNRGASKGRIIRVKYLANNLARKIG